MRIERSFSFTVPSDNTSSRVDSFLSSQIQDLSRSALTGDLCEIYINGSPAKKSAAVKSGDLVELFYVADVFEKVEKQNIPLDIIYEDSSMLVINKAQGMVVHPGAGNPDGTVVNALAWRYGEDFIKDMADECDIARPGIVHRLDKDTSGVLVIALTPKAHENLSAQFQNRKTEKYYLAFCDGIFAQRAGRVECLLARDPRDRKLFYANELRGKTSLSTYEVLRQFEKAALVRVRIHTGRTHQIRVHMKSIGHPVIGDSLYNNRLSRFPGRTLMLHSHSLDICHPVTGEKMHFEAPVPQRFTVLETQLKENLL